MCESENSVDRFKGQLLEIVSNLKSKNDVKLIKNWIISVEFSEDLEKYLDMKKTESKIETIAVKLRESLPWNAVLSSENIKNPTTGPNSDCNGVHTHHIDEFLYDDSDIEDVLNEKNIKQKYCEDCGSTNVKDAIIISHSLSRAKLHYTFNVLLPKNCSDLRILDVGSRIGAVLYSAYFYTNSAHIFGVEINKELCKIQEDMIAEYNMHQRIKIINDDVLTQQDIVATSDIIIMNNVFEFFMSLESQINIWKFLKKTIKKGCLLVTVPSIEESLDNLEVYDDFSGWVEICSPFQKDNLKYFDEETLDFHDLYLYKVK